MHGALELQAGILLMHRWSRMGQRLTRIAYIVAQTTIEKEQWAIVFGPFKYILV